MTVTSAVQSAFEKAQNALINSHSPYSQLKVASCLKLEGRKDLVVGVNVENASFGGTICAERSAMVSAISQYGVQKWDFLLITSSHRGEPIPPCGLCLQFLAEFVTPEFPIYLANSTGVQKSYPFQELLPHAFKDKDFRP